MAYAEDLRWQSVPKNPERQSQRPVWRLHLPLPEQFPYPMQVATR